MAEFVYVLCLVTSMLCAGLLLRSYRKSPGRLLMWSSLCFVGLALNNIFLLLDLTVVPTIDLRLVRSGSGIVALVLLVVGLVWESR